MDARKPDPRLTIRPGAELLRLLPDRWKAAGCGCDHYARVMDFWGDGCEERIDEIVDHLVSQSSKIPSLSRMPRAVRAAIARRLVRLAIRRARRRATAAPAAPRPVEAKVSIDLPSYEPTEWDRINEFLSLPK